ncbi:hypothetical protein GCM10009431_21040 [Gaetbulibacter jejuensis]|uniref:Methyltransferase domain-containing protein n=2 Tax=Gaetbulibacter jejuensis TaxID=584607 RepID=A0ABN1JSA6_9FLAO
MFDNMKSNFTRTIAKHIGNVLVFLRPKKAQELSENRITLVHKNKNNLSFQERLMRFALVQKLETLDDHNKIAEQNKTFWINESATELFTETKDSINTFFIPHCTFIFDLLKQEISNQDQEIDTLVEIGTGNGSILNHLSTEFPNFKKLIGIDLSANQIEINKKKYKQNTKLEFVTSDAYDWIKKNGKKNTVFVTYNGVLEYFLEQQLQELLIEINKLKNIFFVSIEPNGASHDFDKDPNTQLYGDEPSFSHNYPKLFKNAGFTLWHFSQIQLEGESKQTFIGAKN